MRNGRKDDAGVRARRSRAHSSNADSSVDGTRYFQCLPKYATFVRADKVKVGDYPEEDLMSDDDEI